MRKRILIVGGIIVIVLLLAGAAFVGGQLVSGQGVPGAGSAGWLSALTNQGGGSSQHVGIQSIPAKELPQTPADADGIFDHRKDNSIFVGTGQARIMVQPDPSGNVQASSSHAGPTVEVVVTPQTTVYRDATMEHFNGQHLSGDIKVQQVLEPGSLDEIGQNSFVTAWGRKTGDRIIADVLVYTPPPVMVKP
jgi:hypothetical protein